MNGGSRDRAFVSQIIREVGVIEAMLPVIGSETTILQTYEFVDVIRIEGAHLNLFSPATPGCGAKTQSHGRANNLKEVRKIQAATRSAPGIGPDHGLTQARAHLRPRQTLGCDGGVIRVFG